MESIAESVMSAVEADIETHMASPKPRLDISSRQFTSVPDAVWQLTSLRELILTRNQLASLPAAVNSLAGLSALDLSHNLLTTMPMEAAELHKLEVNATSID